MCVCVCVCVCVLEKYVQNYVSDFYVYKISK